MIPCVKIMTLALVCAPLGGVGRAAAAAPLSLSAAQRQAAGITIAPATPIAVPARSTAFGLALDPRPAQADFDASRAAQAAREVAAAELARLRKLYAGGAGASLKSLQIAGAALAQSTAAANAARARFAFAWAPFAALPAARCRHLIDAAVAGSSMLVRADLTGRLALGEIPRTALIDIDGLEVKGRVLGLMRTTGGAQSVGLLIDVTGVPRGFAAGARVPVVLQGARRSGWFVPRAAVLYGDDGAFVYRELPGSAAAAAARFEAVKVDLLMAHAGGWIVDGIGAGDEIVMRGAGVLWSLQGLGGQSADDDD